MLKMSVKNNTKVGFENSRYAFFPKTSKKEIDKYIKEVSLNLVEHGKQDLSMFSMAVHVPNGEQVDCHYARSKAYRIFFESFSTKPAHAAFILSRHLCDEGPSSPNTTSGTSGNSFGALNVYSRPTLCTSEHQ